MKKPHEFSAGGRRLPYQRTSGSAFAGLIALALTASSPALVRAQTASAGSPESSGAVQATTEPTDDTIVELPQFTVAAEKVAKPLAEVPMSVQPIAGETLSAYKLFDAKEITAIAAGLDVNTASPNNPIPSMRGITYDPFSGVQPTVNIYWNELSIDAGTAFKAMYDMGQVEVLRGPQGALRAGAAPGGALLFASRKPDLDAFGVALQQTFSDQDLINSQLALNAPLIKDKLAVRIAGLYDGTAANHVHNIITGHDSKSITRSVRASVGWKPFQALTMNLVHQYMYQVKGAQYGVAGVDLFARSDLPDLIRPSDRIAIAPTDNRNVSKSRLTSLTADLELPGKNQINVIAGYIDNKTDTYISQNRGNLLPNFLAGQYVTTLRSAPTTNVEVRFSSVNHKFWNYSFGGYLSEPDGNTELTLDPSILSAANGSPTSSPSLYVVTRDSKITSKQRIRALFTTQSFNFTKDLKLELGLRQQNTINKAVNSIPLYVMFGSTRVATIPSSPTVTDSDVKPVTGSASLTYKVAKGFNAYFNFSQSYRPPGSGVNGSGVVDANKYFSYRAEKSNGYELGVKTSLLNRTLQLNADIYYQKFDGYQYYATAAVKGNSFVSDSLQRFVVNGDAESKGAEVGLSLSLPKRFVFNMDAAYAQSVWASGTKIPGTIVDPATGKFVFNTPGEVVSFLNVGGKRLGNVPQLTSTARLEWSHPVNQFVVFARSLLRYKSDRILDTGNKDRLGGYGLLDLQLGVRNREGKWDLTFWGKNVLDRASVDYFEDPFTARGYTSGFRQIVVADPVELGVTLSCRF